METPSKEIDGSPGQIEGLGAASPRIFLGLNSRLKRTVGQDLESCLAEDRPILLAWVKSEVADLEFQDVVLQKEQTGIRHGVEAAQKKERYLAQRKDTCERRDAALVIQSRALVNNGLPWTKPNNDTAGIAQQGDDKNQFLPAAPQLRDGLKEIIRIAEELLEQTEALEREKIDVCAQVKVARTELDRLRQEEARIDQRLQSVETQIQENLSMIKEIENSIRIE